MKIEKVSMQRQKAKRLWQEYCQVLKTKQKDYLKEIKEIKACYYQLSKGRPLINIVDVFKKFGFNEKHEPILAFAPAKERFVRFTQGQYSESRRGEGYFKEDTDPPSWKDKIWLSLPVDTFPRLERTMDLNIRTPVPIIPPKFLPKSLRGCYLLWEVESWETARPKKDPILLRKIHGNIYAIMSGWALTDVEAMIMKGRA